VSRAGLEGATRSLHDFVDTFAAMSGEDWLAPSACAGWRVQEVAAHISSNLKEMVEPSPPSSEPPAPVSAEDAMEALVLPRRAWPWEQVRDELLTYAEPSLAVFGAMQEEPTASTPFTLLDLGTYPTHLLADAFAFDLMCHLRNDVLAPRGPVRRDVAPLDEARIAPAVSWMLAGLGPMCSAALGDLDVVLCLELTGLYAGSWRIAREEAGWEVSVVAGNPGASAVVRSDAAAFVLWGTRRERWEELVVLEGDRDLATAWLDRLDIV
jgi:hypothetical protein